MSDHPKSRLPSPIKRRIAVAVTLAAGALASLNSATAATECGAPRYDRATERALFIWKDCTGTGAWQVRVTAGGQPSSVLFEGSVISDRRFGAVTGIRLEATDVMNTGTPKRLDYRLRVGGTGQDGFSFTVPAAAAATCFALRAPAGSRVHLGSTRAAVATPLNLNTLEQCRTDTVTVSDQVLGQSTRYIGAVEGDIDFNAKHLRDLGINAYRIYGGMSRWEAQDDDGIYGLPTIAQIKANPNVVNWTWWDTIMTNPPGNSDYWWSGELGETWQGNARQIFGTLRAEGIRPILTIRNVDNSWNPMWAWQLNPPLTDADRNEWWEHVFATVYWLNVRNDYRVDDFEVHNEPDNSQQGWMGTRSDYVEFVKLTEDAIEHVYQTYLPRRTYRIHAPKTVTWSHWQIPSTLRQISDELDVVNIHNYGWNISSYNRRVHEWMNQTPHWNSPLWLGEWGTYENLYNRPYFALNLLKNMIRASRPRNEYVYGSTIFSLYDWGNTLQGLIGRNGAKRLSYFSFRMGIRALQGGKTTLATTSSNPALMSIATRDANRRAYLLTVNSDAQPAALNADFAAIMTRGTARVWEFRPDVKDRVVEDLTFADGRVHAWLPAKTAVLVRVQ